MYSTNMTHTFGEDRKSDGDGVSSDEHVEDVAYYISDCTHLENLTIDHVCRSLSARFEKHSLYYTWIGTLLVALNPCSEQPTLYSDQVKEDFYNRPLDFSRPHIFAIGQDANSSLKSESGNFTYTAVLSGESGSGKTETGRLLLSYLTWNSRRQRQLQMQDNDTEDRIERKLTEANTILEAFGNAVTTRNHNSSRFGKLSRIRYRLSGDTLSIHEAQIVTYLLAKSRLAHLPNGEQIFHIFYTLCCVNEESQKRGLSTRSEFKIFNPQIHGTNKASSSPPQSESDNHQILVSFERFQRATESCGFQKDQMDLIWDVLHSIILLKNIDFCENCDKSNISINDSCHNMVNQIAIDLWGEDSSDELFNVLTGIQVRDFRRPFRVKDAYKNRDAIMTHLYDQLFSWIVKCLNQSLQQPQSADIMAAEQQVFDKIVQILDIYGFENVENNGTEQLLINYANEKLQRTFFDHLVLNEIRLYESEGLPITNCNYGSSLAIKNIEEVSREIDDRINTLNVIFKLLHDSSFAPVSKEENRDQFFCESVNRLLLANGAKRVAELNVHQFMYRHFAEPMIYNSEGFCEVNNRQCLSKDACHLLQKAPKLDFLLNQTEEDVGGHGFNRSSLGLSFANLVDSLGDNLNHSNILAFVRCIKPNSMDPSKCRAPVPFNKDKVLKQMVHSGLPLVLNVMKFGYPCRIDVHRLRFKLLAGIQTSMFNRLLCSLNDQDFVTLVFKMFKIPTTDFHIGKSGLVFFKHEILGKVKTAIINNNNLLEISEDQWITMYRSTIMRPKLHRYCTIVAFISRLKRSYIQRLKSAIIIQKVWRYKKFASQLRYIRHSVLTLQAVCKGHMARKSTGRKKIAISAIQRMWRRYTQRRRLQLLIQHMHELGSLNSTPETVEGVNSSSDSDDDLSYHETHDAAQPQYVNRRAEALIERCTSIRDDWEKPRRDSERLRSQTSRNRILIEEISKMKAGINHRKKLNRRMKRYGTLRSLSLAPPVDMDHYLNGLPTIDISSARTEETKRTAMRLAQKLRRDVVEPELLVIEDDIDSNLPLGYRYNWKSSTKS